MTRLRLMYSGVENNMEVIHHGGKESVTGSCHELRSDGQALLIDCGLFQGADERPLEICLLITFHAQETLQARNLQGWFVV
ncbi:hypothetical protein [Vibrio mimicus]|uniref:hypothetical protein n=1 Tax=Vibrio mimicus TaxID=674 RepID=UPI002FF3E312